MSDTSQPLIQVNISFRNTNSTDAIKQYATEKVTNVLRKFVHRDTAAEIVLSVEKKERHIAEVWLQADGHDIKGREESTDMYASIDALSDSLTNQLRKNKEKLKDHH